MKLDPGTGPNGGVGRIAEEAAHLGGGKPKGADPPGRWVGRSRTNSPKKNDSVVESAIRGKSGSGAHGNDESRVRFEEDLRK